MLDCGRGGGLAETGRAAAALECGQGVGVRAGGRPRVFGRRGRGVGQSRQARARRRAVAATGVDGRRRAVATGVDGGCGGVGPVSDANARKVSDQGEGIPRRPGVSVGEAARRRRRRA